MTDWLGTGARSIRDVAEKIITEAIRRMKLAVRNDPTFFVPPLSDVSTVLANRIFTHTASLSGGSTVSNGDLSTILAARIFGREIRNVYPSPYLTSPIVGSGNLTLLSGGVVAAGEVRTAYPSARYTVRNTSGAANEKAWDLLATGTAFFLRTLDDAESTAVVAFSVNRTGTTVDNLTLATALIVSAGGLAVTGDSGITGALQVSTSLQVGTGFGCNGQAPQTAVPLSTAGSAVSGTAGALYTVVEQTIINDLVAQVNVLTTLVATMRAALINDGIGS